jgi:hypothetical protein
MQAGRRLGRIT